MTLRLRGIDVSYEHYTSGITLGVLEDLVMLDRRLWLQTAFMLSTSAVISAEGIDVKKQLDLVSKGRTELLECLPYLNKETGGKSAVELEREQAVEQYRQYARRVLGDKKVEEMIANGEL